MEMKEELVKECSSYLAERLTTRGKCNRLRGSCVRSQSLLLWYLSRAGEQQLRAGNPANSFCKAAC